MKVIMFQDQFAEQVRCGSKRQTIRSSARCAPGDVLSLRKWKGQAYRSRQELLRGATCAWVRGVTIFDGCISLDGDILDLAAADQFARADGFGSAGELLAWFNETYGAEPFYGIVIGW
jgi:hypothetical protein